MKFQTAASSDLQPILLNEFRMAATSFNTTAQEEWNLLLSRQKSALALVEAELVGQTVTLLAAGWLPEPTTMVTAQQQHAAATTLSMNINLTSMRQCVTQGIPLAANGQLPPSGPGPVQLPVAALLPTLGMSMAPISVAAVAGTVQGQQGKAVSAQGTAAGTAPAAAGAAKSVPATASAPATAGTATAGGAPAAPAAGAAKPNQADLLRIMQQLLASGGGGGGGKANTSGPAASAGGTAGPSGTGST